MLILSPGRVPDGLAAGAIGEERFEALIFDWDGTAVPDRQADAVALRARIERLSAIGVHVFVVSGTHVGNVDGQLGARPAGPGRLFLCLNRGSEVFGVTRDGVTLLSRRTATEGEERALVCAAELVIAQLRDRGLAVADALRRLNRCKIDLLPGPLWADPPKARIGELLGAVTRRLEGSGLVDLAEVVALARRAGQEAGLADPRVTSDVKHVEIGLTDKSDSASWAAAWLAERGITGRLVLVGGDEFGDVGGVPGSDSYMLVHELTRAVVVSVGVEPGGVPPSVVHLGGGPDRFAALLDAQVTLRAQRRVPRIDDDPAWVVALPDDPARARVAEALGALSNGWAGTRGMQEEQVPDGTPEFVVDGVYCDEDNPRLLPGPGWTHLAVRPSRRGDAPVARPAHRRAHPLGPRRRGPAHAPVRVRLDPGCPGLAGRSLAVTSQRGWSARRPRRRGTVRTARRHGLPARPNQQRTRHLDRGRSAGLAAPDGSSPSHRTPGRVDGGVGVVRLGRGRGPSRRPRTSRVRPAPRRPPRRVGRPVADARGDDRGQRRRRAGRSLRRVPSPVRGSRRR